jgi:hypothetical protein
MTDEGHQRVVDQAVVRQTKSSDAVFWELAGEGPGKEEGRRYALAGQMASAGEQLGLAYAAGAEVALWREWQTKASNHAEGELPMRAVAEAQCLFVIGTGHAVVNVAARALALDSALRAELIKRFKSDFDPFSQEPNDWPSLNKEACKKIRAVARSSAAEELAELVDPVVTFGLGRTWQALVVRRGVDFHRWRPQTHGVEGVPQKSPVEARGRNRSSRHRTPDLR